MKIRILFVIDNMEFGGGQRAFAQIIRGLDTEKFQLFVATQPGGLFEPLIQDRAVLVPFDISNRFNLLKILELRDTIRKLSIQIVHTQGARADFFGRCAARLAGTPAIISTVTMPVERFNVNIITKTIYVCLDRITEPFVHAFIVVSDRLQERLNKIHNIPLRKIARIYNGVELDDYDPLAFRDELKKQMGLEGNILVGVVTRLSWQKGLHYFLQAVSRLETSDCKGKDAVRYLVIGSGELERELKVQAKDLNIADKIVFTGFQKDARQILACLDIFVLPSLQEGQPIALLEAMAFAKPIVATHIEGVVETVEDGTTALLVPPGDPEALSKAILLLLNDTAERLRLGTNARKAVQERFDVRSMIEQHQKLYESVVKDKGE